MTRTHSSGSWLLLATGVVCLALTPLAYGQSTSSQEERSESDDASSPGTAQEPAEEQEEKKSDPGIEATYRDGLRIRSTDGKFAARFRWRAQTRLTNTSSNDLLGEEDGIEEAAGFQIRRARFKLDGHAYQPWLKYYLEYGIVANVMLTLQFDLEPSQKLGVRLGQYKVEYNRERVDSSGAQQFVDRSIVNNPFTVDRQTGPSIRGRLFAGTLADSRYSAGVFTGTGRGGGLDEDRRPMYIGRWQWNFLKRDLPYSQSDIARREQPAASLAFAAMSNEGEFTRFSSSGGGQLFGFESRPAGPVPIDPVDGGVRVPGTRTLHPERVPLEAGRGPGGGADDRARRLVRAGGLLLSRGVPRLPRAIGARGTRRPGRLEAGRPAAGRPGADHRGQLVFQRTQQQGDGRPVVSPRHHSHGLRGRGLAGSGSNGT